MVIYRFSLTSWLKYLKCKPLNITRKCKIRCKSFYFVELTKKVGIQNKRSVKIPLTYLQIQELVQVEVQVGLIEQ